MLLVMPKTYLISLRLSRAKYANKPCVLDEKHGSTEAIDFLTAARWKNEFHLSPRLIQQLPIIPSIEIRCVSLCLYHPSLRIPYHIIYLHPWSQGYSILQVSLYRRCLGTPVRVVQPAHSAMDVKLPYVDIYQAVLVPPVDLMSLWLYPDQLFSAPRLDQSVE